MIRETLGIRTPLIQAPIGSATYPELAAAVSNAGALGMLALSWRSPAGVSEVIARTQRLTPHPFGVNLVLAWPQQDRLRVSIDSGVRIISTSWGDPESLARLIRGSGCVHLHTVGSAEEAVRAVGTGVDVLVAQGVEAGGHVQGPIPLCELLPAVLDVAGRSVPVVAAGGIATGEQAAGLTRLGAAGVWVGTRFLCSRESNVHPEYQAAILAARQGDTYHGEVFDKGWEGAPHRVLRNSTVRAWLRSGSPSPGERPGETDEVARLPDGMAIARYSDVIPTRDCTGQVEALALYAGTGSAEIASVLPAEAIVAEFREALRDPAPARPRVLAMIEASLAASPGVSAAAYFGSTAKGETDAFSDIDLVVSCSPKAAVLFVRRLHALLGLALYRPFTEGRHPAGRYWFRGVSPFQRLDVSFYPPDEFGDLLLNGRGFAQPPFQSIELRPVTPPPEPPPDLPQWSAMDHEFGGALRRLHEAAKAEARGLRPKMPPEVAAERVREFRSRGLRPEAWELFEHTMELLGGTG